MLILFGKNKVKKINKILNFLFIFVSLFIVLFFSQTTSAEASDRYWIGGTGNWSDTAHWSDVNGGSGGYSVPTSTNNVYFSAGSFSTDGNVVTLDIAADTNSLDFSGLTKTMTLTSSVNALNVYGSISLSTKLLTSFSGTASLNFKATTNADIKSNGNTSYWAIITFNGLGGYWTLKDNWNCGNTIINTSYGTLNTNNFNLTARSITTTSTNSFNYILGSSTLTLQLWYAYYGGTTLDAGTSTFKIASFWLPGNKTYYNVELDNVTQSSSAVSVAPASYNNLTIRRQFITGGNQTINGLLTIKNTIDSQRTLIASRDIGTKYTFTSANNFIEATDFRDITGAGSANWDLSSITGGSGDAGGNSGITLTTAQPQYFKHTSGAVSWSNSAKWFSDQAKTIAGRVPLPQDDATFDAESFTGTSILTVDVPRIGRSLDMSGVSQAVTMTLVNLIEVYGSYILGDNINRIGNYELNLMGRNSYIFNSFGKTIYITRTRAFGGTYTNQSNIINSGSFYIENGIFDVNDYNLTCAIINLNFVTVGSLYLGNGLITITTSLTYSLLINKPILYPENATLKIAPISGVYDINFSGGNNIFNKIWFSGSHTGNFDITGSNTFNELIIDPGRKVRFTAGTTQQIGKLTAIGTALNPITISSITAATHTLNYTGATNVVADYLNLSYSTATPANKFFASHSTDGGNNSGWTFANEPDAPTAIGATPGNSQVTLSWSAPGFNGGTAITDYAIEYKLSSEPTIWSTFADGVSTSTTGIVTGLVNASAYDFRVSAINLMGQSLASSTVSSTPLTVPDAPTNIVATRGNAQATISFTPPIFNGGSPITSYTVTSSPGSIIQTGTASPIIVTGLTNGTAYTFSITASNVAGIGSPSTASNSVTPATIPDAPTGLQAIASNAEVGLSWLAPVWNGGEAIIDYVIEYKLSSQGTWSTFAEGTTATTTATVTGLTNALSYDFRVSAANDVGQGSPSLETSARPITVPDAPTEVSGVASNAKVTVSFTPPAFNGGSPINSYTVTSSPGNFTATGSDSPLTVTGLTNGQAYTFTVTATNAVGESLASIPSTPITPVTVPDAPMTVVATEGNKQAMISFEAPAFNGGTVITEYKATSIPGNFTTTGSSSPLIVTGLTNGQTYTFTVTATNAVGESLASSPSNEVTLSTEPEAPGNLASTVLGSSIGLSWSTPTSNGGSSIVDYTIEYQLTTGGNWAIFADGSNTNTTANVIGLSNGTSYDFRVRAINIIGQSLPSNIVTATPGEPAQVLIQNFPNTKVPNIQTAIRITNEGGAPYEYQYTWCLTDSAINLCGGNDDLFSSTAAKLIQAGENWDTTLNSTMLTPGNYYFHVNVVYGSEASNAYQSFTAEATYPLSPSLVVAIAGSGQATISFNTPTFNGGRPISHYTVTSNGGGLSQSGDSSPIIVTGLTNGNTYTFTVTATNDVGTSIASLPSNSIIPMTIPEPPTGLSAITGKTEVTLSWLAPLNNGGSVITDYVIEYKLVTETIWAVFADGLSDLTTAKVTGLTNNQTYDFRVSAVNINGQSSVDLSNIKLPSQKGSSGSSVSQQNIIPTPEITMPIVPVIEAPDILPVIDINNDVVNKPAIKKNIPRKTNPIESSDQKPTLIIAPNEIQVTINDKPQVANDLPVESRPFWPILKVILLSGLGLGGLSFLSYGLFRYFKFRVKIKVENKPETKGIPRRKI